MEQRSFAEYMSGFERCARAYVPPDPGDWPALHEALYEPSDLYRIPPEQALELQYRCVSAAFSHHHEHNAFYRRLCDERSVAPADIAGPDDLDRIPLIPDGFFKDYPSGRDFALWLGNVFTGELPRVVVKGDSPTFDQVLDAFNSAGLVVSYSSGTGGRHTFIPRDRRTFMASEYAIAKSVTNMAYPLWDPDIHGYLLMPNPRKTNLFAGKVCTIYFDLLRDVRLAIDREITTDVIRLAMTDGGGLKGRVVRFFSRRAAERMIVEIVRWLELHQRMGDRVAMVGAPYIIAQVLDSLRSEGRTFDFGGRGYVVTGGGWKIRENARVTAAEFRGQLGEVLGIADTDCLDIYGMVEANGWMVHCPEGHYLHVPYSYFRPLVLDAGLQPLPYGEWGRFAFLDGAAMSYPGFVITGDQVRMLERCPVCDRPGPVLEPEISRAAGADMRGCAEEVRRMMSIDLGG